MYTDTEYMDRKFALAIKLFSHNSKCHKGFKNDDEMMMIWLSILAYFLLNINPKHRVKLHIMLTRGASVFFTESTQEVRGGGNTKCPLTSSVIGLSRITMGILWRLKPYCTQHSYRCSTST